MRLAAGDRAGALLAYDESLAIARKPSPPIRAMPHWQTNLVISLYKVGTASDPPRARAVLREALAIVERLARDGKLTDAEQDWPQLLRDALAKLPPEEAEAR